MEDRQVNTSTKIAEFTEVLRGPAHRINLDALRARNAERVAEAIDDLKRRGLYVLTRGEPIVKRKS